MANRTKLGCSHRTTQSSIKSWTCQVLAGLAFTSLGLVSEGLAQTTVSPTSLTYYAVAGGANPPNQTVTLSKSQSSSSTLTAADNAAWLAVSPTNTSLTTSAKMTVIVNTKGLLAGTYRATITFTVGTWSKTTVPVTLIISPAPQSTGVTTKSASLVWKAVTNTAISGYKVYVGEAPRQYSRTISVGNITSATVNSLTVGRVYYFVVTAYNSAGESPPSNEVSKAIP